MIVMNETILGKFSDGYWCDERIHTLVKLGRKTHQIIIVYVNVFSINRPYSPIFHLQAASGCWEKNISSKKRT